MRNESVLEELSFFASSPVRLSLGGGGTDLPFYADEFGCDLTAVALSARVSVVLGPAPLTQGEHDGPDDRPPAPYIAAATAKTGASPRRSVASLSRVPRGSGLGGSAAFATALIAACQASIGMQSSPAELAEDAWALEVGCGVYAGRQDPYATAHGGLIRLTSAPGSLPEVEPMVTADGFVQDLESRVRLYFTGVTRRSTDSVVAPVGAALRERIAYLNDVKAIGQEIVGAIKNGKVDELVGLIAAHSALKRETCSASRWAYIEALAQHSGAQATKLVGAGGGGFILVLAEPDAQPSLDATMKEAGLPALQVTFSEVGTRCRAFNGDEWKN